MHSQVAPPSSQGRVWSRSQRAAGRVQPGAVHRPLRARIRCSDTRSILGGDTQRSALILRSDDTPEMHDPVRYDDAAFTGIRPLLLAQLGEQLGADCAVLLFVGRSRLRR